eukprot:592614_1
MSQIFTTVLDTTSNDIKTERNAATAASLYLHEQKVVFNSEQIQLFNAMELSLQDLYNMGDNDISEFREELNLSFGPGIKLKSAIIKLQSDQKKQTLWRQTIKYKQKSTLVLEHNNDDIDKAIETSTSANRIVDLTTPSASPIYQYKHDTPDTNPSVKPVSFFRHDLNGDTSVPPLEACNTESSDIAIVNCKPELDLAERPLKPRIFIERACKKHVSYNDSVSHDSDSESAEDVRRSTKRERRHGYTSKEREVLKELRAIHSQWDKIHKLYNEDARLTRKRSKYALQQCFYKMKSKKRRNHNLQADEPPRKRQRAAE